MFRQEEQQENHFWMSYTDLVTGFLIIFIIVMFILYNQNSEQQVIQAAYGEMESSMTEEFKNISNVEVSDEATIRFLAERGELFEVNEYELTKYFKKSLDEVIPIYFEKLYEIYTKDSKKVIIKEIRIEGHTDSYGNYFANLKLSGNRARKVQEYIMQHPNYNKLDWKFRLFLKQNFISCGYSFSKLLDKEGNRTDDKSKEDKDKSRRVEFRVLLEYKTTKENEN